MLHPFHSALVLTLATGLLPAALVAASPAPAAVRPAVTCNGDAVAELSADYEKAYLSWRQAIREAANLDERRALREKAPAVAYYARFADLAGEHPQALIWMGSHASDALSRKAAKTAVAANFKRLVEDHRDRYWAREIIVPMVKQRRLLGEDVLNSNLLQLGAGKNADAASWSLFILSKQLVRRKANAAAKSQSQKLQERILKEFAGTEAAQEILVARSASSYEVGGTPLDFTTVDTDGVEFKLSDYRGKVVMLDFWGFW